MAKHVNGECSGRNILQNNDRDRCEADCPHEMRQTGMGFYSEDLVKA